MDILKSIFKSFITDVKTELKEPLICPQCREQLEGREKFGITIYTCYNCGGCFMNQENLKIFLDFHNKENWPELFNLKTDTEHTYNRSRETRRCPSCKKRMDNIEFRYHSGIWVDYCTDGEGIWLDSGEIELIKNFNKTMTKEKLIKYEEDIMRKEAHKRPKLETPPRSEPGRRNTLLFRHPLR